MTEITMEMLAAGTAAMEENVGGDYLRCRKAVVQIWAAMNRAKAGDEEPGGGDTFTLTYGRNLALAKELDAYVEKSEAEHQARVAAAQEHGFPIPEDTDPNAAREREWRDWLAANS